MLFKKHWILQKHLAAISKEFVTDGKWGDNAVSLALNEVLQYAEDSKIAS